MWDLESRGIIKRFYGHHQAKLKLYYTFCGLNEDFIACGSESKSSFVLCVQFIFCFIVAFAHPNVLEDWLYQPVFISDIILISITRVDGKQNLQPVPHKDDFEKVPS